MNHVDMAALLSRRIVLAPKLGPDALAIGRAHSPRKTLPLRGASHRLRALLSEQESGRHSSQQCSDRRESTRSISRCAGDRRGSESASELSEAGAIYDSHVGHLPLRLDSRWQ